MSKIKKSVKSGKIEASSDGQGGNSIDLSVNTPFGKTGGGVSQSSKDGTNHKKVSGSLSTPAVSVEVTASQSENNQQRITSANIAVEKKIGKVFSAQVMVQAKQTDNKNPNQADTSSVSASAKLKVLDQEMVDVKKKLYESSSLTPPAKPIPVANNANSNAEPTLPTRSSLADSLDSSNNNDGSESGSSSSSSSSSSSNDDDYDDHNYDYDGRPYDSSSSSSSSDDFDDDDADGGGSSSSSIDNDRPADAGSPSEVYTPAPAPRPSPAPSYSSSSSSSSSDDSSSDDSDGKPIILDLDGDGIELVDVTNSNIFFDMNGDGYRNRTSWVGKDDGILAIDLGNDGKVTDFREIVMTTYDDNARTDLEGLRAFDTNGDGVFSANDKHWNKFGVWQDKNQNGITDDGEFSHLDDFGLKSISLSSDEKITKIGSSTSYGTGEYEMTDGRKGKFGDIALRYQGKPKPADKMADIAQRVKQSNLYEGDQFTARYSQHAQNADSAVAVQRMVQAMATHGADKLGAEVNHIKKTLHQPHHQLAPNVRRSV